MQFLMLDELIPKDHILRQIDETVDFTFIYKLVVDKYTFDKDAMVQLELQKYFIILMF